RPAAAREVGAAAEVAHVVLQVRAGVDQDAGEERREEETEVRRVAVQHGEARTGEHRGERDGERPGTQRQPPGEHGSWRARERERTAGHRAHVGAIVPAGNGVAIYAQITINRARAVVFNATDSQKT